MSSASSSPAPDASAATAPSPAPAYDPQAVGKGFVKAYYNQLLAGEQEKLVNFYVPSTLTYLSHAEGQEMTTPVALEDYKSQLQTTNRWGKDDDETMGIVMHGMDVHQTSPDSLLVVVTAMMRFFKSTDSGRTERQKFFVQTFFLARQGAWGVQNDILRFLDPAATAAVSSKGKGPAAPATTETTKTAVASTDEKMPEPGPAADTPADDAEEKEKAKIDDDAPGGGVEESKEEPPEEADEAETAPTGTAPPPEASTTKGETAATKDDKSKGDKNKGKKAAPAPSPGSWASLVATGGSAPNTPSRKSVEKPEASKETATQPSASAAVKAKESDEPKSKAKAKGTDAPPVKSAPAAKSGGGGGRGGDRKNERTFNADCTLVIKNLDKASQEDVIKLFTPFATSTKSRLVGAHVNTFRKLAFVDFDAVAPVMAALKQHADTPIQWNGHVLEVDQKSAEQRARREAARGGSYNGDRNGSGGGGRGRGDRGSKRGSGSKGGGRGGK